MKRKLEKFLTVAKLKLKIYYFLVKFCVDKIKSLISFDQ